MILHISVSSRLTQVESSRFWPTDSSRLKSSRFFQVDLTRQDTENCRYLKIRKNVLL